MVILDFGGIDEEVVTQDDFSLSKAIEVLKDETLAIIGYGIQAPAQALNLRDQGLNVIVGQRHGKSYDNALHDGWQPGKDLFSIEEAARRGTVIFYLLSDAGQKEQWSIVKPHLTEGKTLYFSHGFSITYKHLTGVTPPKNIDIVMVAPKGSGTSLRRNFLAGKGINSSYSIYQNYSGKAWKTVVALGIAIGSNYLFPTTFEKEVFSDLVGERGVLMGAINGIMTAQYKELRRRGHTPSEAFNETVEELTQSLIRLVDENGMDWMYANCSTTAQRGALDWTLKFEEAVRPVFKELYDSVITGKETKRVLEANSASDYKDKLAKELSEIHNSEMWKAGAVVRSLRSK
ncbi:MAG: ketol-acid reductoisomerase [Asgard group archaeon]|nr:ketol-acid reductoisomerase [Asgard group archaeon]